MKHTIEVYKDKGRRILSAFMMLILIAPQLFVPLQVIAQGIDEPQDNNNVTIEGSAMTVEAVESENATGSVKSIEDDADPTDIVPSPVMEESYDAEQLPAGEELSEEKKKETDTEQAQDVQQSKAKPTEKNEEKSFASKVIDAFVEVFTEESAPAITTTKKDTEENILMSDDNNDETTKTDAVTTTESRDYDTGEVEEKTVVNTIATTTTGSTIEAIQEDEVKDTAKNNAVETEVDTDKTTTATTTEIQEEEEEQMTEDTEESISTKATSTIIEPVESTATEQKDASKSVVGTIVDVIDDALKKIPVMGDVIDIEPDIVAEGEVEIEQALSDSAVVEKVAEENGGEKKEKLKLNKDLTLKKGSVEVAIADNTEIEKKNTAQIDATELSIVEKSAEELEQELDAEELEKLEGAQAAAEFGIPGEHLVFSKPVRMSIPVPGKKDGEIFEIKVQHEGEGISTKGITMNPNAVCNADGTSSDENNKATVKDGAVEFYTCGASLFIVDNNVNNVTITDIAGSCQGSDYVYDVYWNADAGETTVDLVDANTSAIIAGAQTVSPITVTLTNNTSTTPFDVFVQETGNTANKSANATVSPVDCSAVAPGGVNTALKLWFMGDTGALDAAGNPATDGGLVRLWDNQSAALPSLQANANIDSNSPVYRTNSINFHDALDFEADTNNKFDLDYDTNPSARATQQYYFVYKLESNPSSPSRGLLGNDNGSYDTYITPQSIAGNNANVQDHATAANVAGEVKLLTTYLQHGVANGSFAYVDGKQVATFTYDNAEGGGGTTPNGFAKGSRIGGIKAPGLAETNPFDGLIAEVVGYDGDQSLTRNKIESYLALKYGITLDQTTATDYLASDGSTKIWDSSLNAAYNKDIFGIGRDDASGLDQRIAKSVNAGAVLTVENGGVDFTSQNSAHTQLPADKQFLTFANNGGATTTQTTEIGGNYNTRITREWQVQNVGSVGAVNVKFDDGANSFAGFDLLSDTDGDFSTTGDQTVLGTLDANGELTGVTFTHGAYLTLAKQVAIPGGVSTGLSVWMRADSITGVTSGSSVATWQDSGPAQYTATSTNNPVYSTNTADAVNFNPVVKFSGSDYFTIANGVAGNGVTHSSMNAFIVKRHNTNNIQQFDFVQKSTAGSGTRISSHLPWSNGTAYWDAGLTVGDGRLTTASGVNVGDISLWSLLSRNDATPEQKIRKDGAQLAADNTALNFNADGSDFFIGSDAGVTSIQDDIAELILFLGNTPLTNTEIQQIESYLALKYGKTLDQTTATDYLASDGSTKIWDSSLNAAYNKDIFGIGRDDASGLDQRIAKSVNAGAVLTVENGGVDFTSQNSAHTQLPADKQFLTFANDGGTTTTQTTEISAPYNLRITREWQVQNVGGVGAVNVKFDDGANSFVGFDLLSDTDGDFSTTGDQTVLGTLDANGELQNVTFTDGAYLTLAKSIAAPGGIFGASLWLKADDNGGVTTDGATVSTWADQSGAGNDGIAAGTATYESDSASQINFNPTILSANASFALPNNTLSINDENFDYFAVLKTPLANNVEIVFRSGFNSNNKWVRVHLDSDGSLDTRFNIVGINNGPAGSITANKPVLIGSDYNTGANTMNNYINGGIDSIQTGVSNKATVDTDHSVLKTFNGNVAEMVVYKTDKTGTDAQQINSYLALKYGITLDQSTPQDYLATDGTTKMWDSTLNATYNNDIFGIGKDTVSTLDQRISHSENSDGIITLSTDSDFTAENSTHADTITNLKFLTVANNNGTASWTATGAPSGYQILSRVWQAQNNGVTGTNIAFDVANPDFDVPAPIGTSDYYLVVDSNNNGFADDTPILLTNNGGDIWSKAQDFANGDTFTLATVDYSLSIAKTSDGAEPGTGASFTITVTPANTSGSEIIGSIAYGGTATEGTDYATGPTTFSIPNGVSTAVVTLTTLDDTVVESDETIVATISNPSIGVIATDTATATLSDDDTATVTIADTSGNEDGGAITVTATVDNPVAGGFTVEVNTADGTATLADSDYTQISSQTLTFAGTAGETQTFTLTPTADTTFEADETVTISMANASNTAVDITDTATVTIANDDSATVSVSATDAQAQEGQGDNGEFTITLDTTAPTDITVNYTVGGTALAAGDYTPLSGTATILAGSSSTSVTVDAGGYNDPLTEGDETVTITLTGTNNTAVTLGATTTATVVIADDETDPSAGGTLLEAKISATVATANEGTGSAGQYTITLDNAVTQDTTLTYTISGGATAGADYDALSGTITIPGGSTTGTINIITAGHNDTLIEADEYVIVTLTSSNNGGVAIGASPNDTATVTIVDDETDPSAGGTAVVANIIATDASAAENPADNGVFTISLDNAVTEDTTITYVLTGTAAKGFDYADALNGTVTIPGGSTSATITIDTASFNDTLVEGDETVVATLNTNSNGGVSNSASSATVTIADDEALLVTLSANDATAFETSGDSGQFTVTMDGTAVNDVVVSYSIAGSATNAADYSQLTGSVTIPAGSTSATIDIAVTDDTVIEGDETVTLTLTGTNNGVVNLGATVTDTVTISDNDTATVSVTASDASATESPEDNGAFTISLNGITASDLAVTYTVSGSATAGTDYVALSGTATIPAGTNSVTIPVDVTGKDDTLFESAEMVTLTLAGTNLSSNVSLASAPNNSATVTITDDEASSVTADVSVTQNGNEAGTVPMIFTVTLNATNNTGSPITFDTAFTGGTATEAVGATLNDYVDVDGAGTITIANGASSATLIVSVEDDAVYENTETAELTAGNPSNTDITMGVATVVANIFDNDPQPQATTVSISSDNALSSSQATTGDTITLSLMFGTAVQNVSATIAGITATISQTSSTVWSAVVGALTGTETQGPAAITIDAESLGGGTLTQIVSTTDGSAVTIDFTAPTSTPPTIGTTTPSAGGTVGPTLTIPAGSCGVEYANGQAKFSTNPAGNINPDPTIVALDANGDYAQTTLNTAGSTGTFDITLACTDAAGNVGPTLDPAAGSYTVDHTAPVIAIDSPLMGDDLFNASEQSAVTISGTTDAEDGQTVTVQVGIAVGTATVSSGVWTLSMDLSGEADGTLTITANVQDIAGNSATPASGSIVKDATVPTTTPTDPTMQPETGAVNTPITIPAGSCGAEYANGSVTFSSNPAGNINPDPTVVTLDANGDYAQTALDTSGSTGTFTIDMVCADRAGNPGPSVSPAGGSYVADHTAPNVPSINTATNGSPVSGTGEPGATVTVSTPSGASCTATVQNDGTWSCTLSPAPTDGEDISAYQTDGAGNQSSVTTVSGGINTSAQTSIAVDGTKIFTENSANDGSMDNTVVLAITGDTFTNAGGTLTNGTDYTISNVPAGLTASVLVSADGSRAVVTLAGNATAHENSDDVANMSIVFADSAFTNSSASNVLGTTLSLQIDFFSAGGGIISWSGFFNEATANDGSINASGLGSTLTATIAGDSFVGGIALGTQVNISNVPAGLTPVVTQVSSSVINITLSGTALSHTAADSMSNLIVSFADSTFTGGDASAVAGSTYTSGIITFNDAGDSDGDGVADTDETAGANGGDANGDGVQDAQQQGIATVANAVVSGGSISVEAQTGNCSVVRDVSSSAESGIAVQDVSGAYPIGLINFTAQCPSAGETETIRVWLDREYIDANTWVFRKYFPATQSYVTMSPQPTVGTTTLANGPDAGKTVTYFDFAVTDGDTNTDSDTLADRFITDPMGPALPVLNWSTDSQTSADENGTMTVTATLSFASPVDVTVPFTISGSATDGSDYTVTASPLTISAGSTSASATITITDDNVDDDNDTVILTLGTTTGASLGVTTVHTATITDNDNPVGGGGIAGGGSGGGGGGNPASLNGCTDNTATNYLPSALYDDGNCVYAQANTNQNDTDTTDDNTALQQDTTATSTNTGINTAENTNNTASVSTAVNGGASVSSLVDSVTSFFNNTVSYTAPTYTDDTVLEAYNRSETDSVGDTTIPKHLFDINTIVNKEIICTNEDMESVISFESFGTAPQTDVTIEYSIINEYGQIVSVAQDAVQVETSKVVKRTFADIQLEPGTYTLIIKTVYGDNVTDEFMNEFTVIECQDSDMVYAYDSVEHKCRLFDAHFIVCWWVWVLLLLVVGISWLKRAAIMRIFEG